jgi:hypothetical protein
MKIVKRILLGLLSLGKKLLLAVSLSLQLVNLGAWNDHPLVIQAILVSYLMPGPTGGCNRSYQPTPASLFQSRTSQATNGCWQSAARAGPVCWLDSTGLCSRPHGARLV